MELVDNSKWAANNALVAAAFATPVSSTLTDTTKSLVTGTELEDDFSGATIGKEIAVFVGGQILAGCRLYEGPFLSTVSGEGFVDYIVGPFVLAVPGAELSIDSIRMNGTESLTSADGGTTWTPLGTVFDDVVINLLRGTETQTPFASSLLRYGARAVPYRSHVCIELQNVPLAPFANLIPFISVYIVQEESITRQEAVSRILEYSRFSTSQFEVNVSGTDVFWILPGDQGTVFDFLRDLQRSIFRNVNIVATDKLRIFENSSTTTPIEITREDVSVDSIKFWIDPPESVPSDRVLGFVDTDGDNDFNTVKVSRARFPIPLTSSQDIQELDIPIGMSRVQAKALNAKSILIDHFARHKCSFKLLPTMRGIEPGDILELDFDQEFPNWRVLSIARNSKDWTSAAVCERVELSLLSIGPSITSNGGGATASISVNEEQTAVTAVTADQEGEFSIVGGADAAFFTIDSETGILSFLSAPDFEDPQDSDGDNEYEVTVQILADGLAGTQIITVTVVNVAEGGDPGALIGFPFPYTQA
jgi:hypothetical protein